MSKLEYVQVCKTPVITTKLLNLRIRAAVPHHIHLSFTSFEVGPCKNSDLFSHKITKLKVIQ